VTAGRLQNEVELYSSGTHTLVNKGQSLKILLLFGLGSYVPSYFKTERFGQRENVSLSRILTLAGIVNCFIDGRE